VQSKNKLRCTVTRVTQDVFSAIIMLTTQNASGEEHATIRMEVPTAEAKDIHAGDTVEIGIESENIMLLR
jgi:hypothetical protein